MLEYTLILSASLLFGPHCESGCRVLTGHDTPVGTFEARPMDYKAIGFEVDGKGGVFAIHPVWTLERKTKLGSDERTRITAGCVNIGEDDFNKLPRRAFRLIIKK